MAQLPLQKYQAVDWRGLTTDAHFYNLYMKKPQVINAMVRQIYKTNLRDTYNSFINQFPTKYVEDENGFYEWMLKGQDEKNYVLLRAELLDGTLVDSGDDVGAGVSQFVLVFSENFADINDVLQGDEHGYAYKIFRVEQNGSETKYIVELMTGSLTTTVPGDLLQGGIRFSKDYNLQPGTLSSRGTRPNFSSGFAMENTISRMRMEYDVAGSTIRKGTPNDPLEFAFQVPGTNEMIKPWINYLDIVSMHQFENQFARLQMYGMKNWDENHKVMHKDPDSKFEITAGSGFFEQIDPANREYYNKFDLNTFVDMILDRQIGKTNPGDRHFEVWTGEFGAIEIHKQIEAKAQSWTIISAMANFITKSAGNEVTGGNPTYGFGQQFNEYRYVNGVKITVKIMPFFDDDIRHSRRHPNGKGTIESHRMLVMSAGGEDAGIYKVRVKGQPKVWKYIEGLRSPFSPYSKQGSGAGVASKVDGYTVMCMDWGGMLMEDPTKVIDYRLNVNR